MPKLYAGLGKVLRMYWRAYGGFRSLFFSPFFHAAVVLSVLCYPFWSSAEWWNTSIAIVPAILGFSIAAFALLLAVGDDGFKRKLGVGRSGGRPSILTSTSAGILHFILVQVFAIFLAILAGARPMSFLLARLDVALFPGWLMQILVIVSLAFRGFGFFLLCYSLTTAVAATLNIFRLATVFSTYATHAEAREKGHARRE